jgi:thiamine-phosphate pyrophosphorylase
MSEIDHLRLARRERLSTAGVYLVTEEVLSQGRTSIEVAEAALGAGIGAIQVREKETTARRALEIALALRALTRERGALLLVNDRLDLALAAGADGVHLGQDDVPVSTARALLGPQALIGLSMTHPDQLDAPDAAQADYLGVGAVFPTSSKADAEETGLELLAAARARSEVPIVAIGGITVENAPAAIRAGAHVVAVISAVCGATDPAAAARQLLEAVGRARTSGSGQGGVGSGTPGANVGRPASRAAAAWRSS